MINELINLANRLDELGLIKSATQVDALISKATKSPELAQMIEEMNKANPPQVPYTLEQIDAITEKVRKENEANPSKIDDAGQKTPMPGTATLSWFEAGRIHAEQNAGRRRKVTLEGFPAELPESTSPTPPNASKSLKNYSEYGPLKGKLPTLEDALQYTQGYLSETDLSQDEKDAQIAEVQQNFQ